MAETSEFADNANLVDSNVAGMKSYAHENYVQLNAESNETTQLHAVLAARLVSDLLQKIMPEARWAFRGFIALRCHVPDFEQYYRFTDDVDIAVDSNRYESIDEIEEILLAQGPTYFQRLLSPSKLWKVHYVIGGVKVRLDIYLMTMHNVGKGFYSGCKIEWKEHPQQFAECRPFVIPVMTASALLDLKLVAFLERNHDKDFQDIFFLLWNHEIDQEVGLPWYASQFDPKVDHVIGKLNKHGVEYLKMTTRPAFSDAFGNNLAFISKLKKT